MATGREHDARSDPPLRAPAGSVSRVLAASAVRLLEQDADLGDPQTQRAIDDAVEAIAERLVRLADLCHDTVLGHGAAPGRGQASRRARPPSPGDR